MTRTVSQPTAMQMAVRTALILFAFVTVFTGLLSGAYFWTLPTIQAAASEEKMTLIDEVLPRSGYDNDLLHDTVEIAATPALGQDGPTMAYRARQGDVAKALVLEAIAPDGYGGKIRMIVALAPDSTVLGVRVTQHKETPGLGDYVDPKKDKNKARPWITQFDGQNPTTMDERAWKVKKDGGRFDSVAGATVTPRAVVKAVRKAALFVAENRDTLFARP